MMKRLTAITAILAGIAAVSGLFGMSEAGSAFNFQEQFGFWLVCGFVVMLGVATFLSFRHIDWI